MKSIPASVKIKEVFEDSEDEAIDCKDLVPPGEGVNQVFGPHLQLARKF